MQPWLQATAWVEPMSLQGTGIAYVERPLGTGRSWILQGGKLSLTTCRHVLLLVRRTCAAHHPSASALASLALHADCSLWPWNRVKWQAASALCSSAAGLCRHSCCRAQAYDMPDSWDDFTRMGREAGFARVQQAHLGKKLYGNLIVFSC